MYHTGVWAFYELIPTKLLIWCLAWHEHHTSHRLGITLEVHLQISVILTELL